MAKTTGGPSPGLRLPWSQQWRIQDPLGRFRGLGRQGNRCKPGTERALGRTEDASPEIAAAAAAAAAAAGEEGGGGNDAAAAAAGGGGVAADAAGVGGVDTRSRPCLTAAAAAGGGVGGEAVAADAAAAVAAGKPQRSRWCLGVLARAQSTKTRNLIEEKREKGFSSSPIEPWEFHQSPWQLSTQSLSFHHCRGGFPPLRSPPHSAEVFSSFFSFLRGCSIN